MYKTFTLPLKSAFALAALFILTACGGFTIDLNSYLQDSECSANPFLTECDSQRNISAIRTLIIDDCASNPEKANTRLCLAADAATDTPDTTESCEDNPFGVGCGGTGEVADVRGIADVADIEGVGGSSGTTPKDKLAKSEFNKGDGKITIASLEIVDLCSDPTTADNERCTPAVIACINNPFSGSCQGDNVLGNFVRGAVTVSKTVVLQDKRAEDCRTGSIDRALCQNLNVQKQRCTGAAFGDAICSAVTHSVCKADAFDPLCGEKENFAGVYFNERSEVCYAEPNNPNCTGTNGHIAVVCSEYPFDRLCDGNANYENVRANACEANPNVSPNCPVVVPTPTPTSNRVTTADWLASFDTPLRTQSSIRLQNNGPRHWNQFLKSTRAGLDTSGLEVLSLTSTSFANATFDGQSLGGDALGGAYSLRTYLNGLINNFASVHSDTDLGAPISETAGTQLIWHGAFQYATRNYSVNRRGFDSHTQDFDLEINFGTGNKVGTVEAFVKKNRSDYNNTYFHLKGEFDADGVIDGTVKSGYFQDHDRLRIVNDGFSSYSRGSLSGLIGQKGAVGVIQGYTGAAGFVATPNARFNPNVRQSDWANSFDLGALHNFASYDNDQSTDEGLPAFFVRGDETGIHSPFNSLSGVHFAPNFLENTLDFSDINPALDSADKVSYVATAQSFGTAGTLSGRVGHAAGIWSTTDLGLPLASRPADAHGNPHKATWGGKLGLIVNAQLLDSRGAGTGLIPTRDIGLVVDYTNQTIHNTSTIDGAHQIVLNGRWTNSADNSQNGVIDGDITYNAAPASTGSTAYAGVVKGIIGQEGAVGAFVRDGTNFDYVGGFIAHPSTVFVPPVPATPQVTAAVWADSFDEPLATAASDDDIWSEFLIGRATDLDDGGVRGYYDGWRDFDYGNFNLADATFNGVALGGDAEDGMAFFASKIINSYAGILSGTNLGAPLTQTVGTAKWIGSFKVEAWTGVTDFVLNVSFGTGEGAGEIEALVQLHWYSRNYHIKGEFDDAGVITGTAPRGTFRTHDQGNRGLVYGSGRLTGLIGEEGAVGAIIVGDYYAGFVARPSSAEELRTLTETCADDPFHKWCNLGYEAERNAVVEHCITDDNALNVERCGSVNKFHLCIKHPFLDDCNLRLSSYYEQTRANRIAFCRTVGNADNALCTIEDTFAYICKKHPFDVQCLGSDRFMPWRRTACTDDPFATRCAGDGYNDLRVAFCARNASNPACPVSVPTITEVATPQVTAKVWADSFASPLSHAASAADIWSKLLVGRATDLNNGGLRTTRRGNLNFADATFNGVALGGDAEDGMAFFASYPLNSYAGILSGTNLGAPLTDTAGSAKWVGSFLLEVWSRTDFVLNVSFGTGDGAGEIEGLVQLHPYYLDVHVKGEFDDAGVITGTVARGIYRTNDPNNRGVVFRHRGRLTGLIGEEGAVGAFTVGNYYGGFVARPSSSAELRNVEETCNDDPFHKWCNLGYETERDAILDHCIIGGNANDESCGSANELDDCINDPFQSDCDDRLPQYYQQARANRIAFCRTVGNAGNALCTVEDTFAHICTNHPFDAQCLGNNDYDSARRITCSGDPFAPRCAGEGYNDLRVTFCENNAGNPACPRPEPTANPVTTADWLASFNSLLSAGSTSVGNHFVKAIATGLDGTTRKGFLAINGVPNTDDDDVGVSFFTAIVDGRTRHYAGIFTGTRLGNPLTVLPAVNGNPVTATWNGQLGIIANDSAVSVRDMNLSVDFTNQTISHSSVLNTGLKSISLDGTWADNGVIDGTITYDPNPVLNAVNARDGVVRGLIGQYGAVGAFISNDDVTDMPFAGGFVAKP